MRRSTPLLLVPLVALLVVGCPEGDVAVDLVRDVGNVGFPDTRPRLDSSADTGGSDGSDGVDGSDGTDGTGDVGQDVGGADAPDVSDHECEVDDDCLAVVGPLGQCRVPLCEDYRCSTDKKPPSPCDDGDLCTTGDACTKGECVGIAVPCDDQNACTSDTCNPFTGLCESTPVGASDPVVCDDGDPCTTTDNCEDGACTAIPQPCPACTGADDCKALDDGNPCNGVVGCVNGLCGTVPGSPVSCDALVVGVCEVAACDPVTGSCIPMFAADGTACVSNSKCEGEGACVSGKCVAPPVLCDDKNPCTQDLCDTSNGCVTKPLDGGACDDGNACTADDVCTGGACVGVELVPCDDGNPCTTDSCDTVAKTCTYSPVAGPCSDGNACTADSCVGGACVSTVVVCDDNDACTTDACDAVTGQCAYTAKSCSDNDACTADSCNPATGACSNPAVSCDDGNACTVDACKAATGCTHTALTCTDGDPCTQDACDPAKGCVFEGPGGACTTDADCADADPCTLNSCTGACGTCVVKAFPCFDGDACTTDTCLPGVGCQFSPATGVPCDDGDVCTANDLCFQGGCVGGSIVCELGTAENPSPNCQTILQLYPGKPSGLYWLRPSVAIAPFQAYCDMVTAGGGFTRVANIGGERPLCSLGEAIGTAADVAAGGSSGGASTAILPVEVAGAIPFVYRQILVVFSTGGYYLLSSGSDGFTWSAVAGGTINSSNVATYAVEGAKNGGNSELLKSNAVVSPFKGGALIGGSLAVGTSPYLGVGSQRTGKFTNDAACAAITGSNGIYKSALFGGNAWGGKATILVR